MMKEPILLFNIDIRLFWLADFGAIELRPFIGYDLAFVGHYGNSQSNNLFCAGIELVLNQIGIEYTFVGLSSPLIVNDYAGKDLVVPGTGTTHRLGIIYRLRQR